MDINELTKRYAGAIGLLTGCFGQVDDDTRDSIELAVADFCNATGWSYARSENRVDVFPPPRKTGFVMP